MRILLFHKSFFVFIISTNEKTALVVLNKNNYNYNPTITILDIVYHCGKTVRSCLKDLHLFFRFRKMSGLLTQVIRRQALMMMPRRNESAIFIAGPPVNKVTR